MSEQNGKRHNEIRIPEKWRLEARRNERALHATLWTGAGLVLAIGLMHIVIHWTVCR